MKKKGKKLSWLNKLIYFLNVVFAALLLCSYILPFAQPKTFPILSVLSLLVPVFIIINVIFLCYWLLNLRKQVFLSTIALVLGFGYINSFYKFSGAKETTEKASDISIMSYNVRLFNVYNWIKEKDVDKKIVSFIKEKNPDILALQEFHANQESAFKNYPYRYIDVRGKKKKVGQAIFSKFPIVHKGSLTFPNTSNNAIYIDILKNKDTIRIYNIHLESLHINPKEEALTQENSERLIKRMATTFKMQQFQAELFQLNSTSCTHKKIIAGDFNNTAFSSVYDIIKGDMNDAFIEAGSGFGKTLDYPFFPMRIDFILNDQEFSVDKFMTYSNHYSDHFPIMAEFSSK